MGVGLGCRVGVWIDGLPDGEEPVDVCVVQPEDWVEAGVWDVAHVSSPPDQAVDAVVHIFERIIGCASAVRVSSVGERSVVGLIGDQLISRVVNGLSIGLESQVG